MAPPVSLRSVRRNLPYFRSELGALVGNLSLSVKFICICVICSYILSWWPPAIDALSITPGNLLPPSFKIWTLFTSPFLEIHLWEVIVDCVTVGLCGKLIEPLWGAKEMILFFTLINLSVEGLSVLYYLFLYSATSDPSVLFYISIHGLAGYIAAVTVTVRQIMPDHVIVRTPMGKITNRNIPLTVWTVSIIAWVIGILEGTYCTMFASGCVMSWIYLRFYQRHSNGTRGDMAENFNFAGFFPNVIQPPISVISNSVYQFFVRVGCCKKPVKRFIDSSGPSSISISLPGSDPHDAERRRQKALKLLNERLGGKDSEARKPLIRPESPEISDIPDSISVQKYGDSKTSASSSNSPPLVDLASSSSNNTLSSVSVTDSLH